MSLFRYRVHGLILASDIALPELEADKSKLPADVAVLSVTDLPQAAPTDVAFTIDGVASFLMRGGTDMFVHPAPGAPDRNLRLFILGSALGAILHQRGLLPLHANAIVVDGTAIAFSGASGAGKSTLAAWAHDQGHDILADDVCVIGEGEAGPLAMPGLRRLRLWRDALERSGRDPDAHPRSFEDDDDFDKFDLRLADRTVPGPRPLGVIAILREGPLKVSRMPALAAAEALFANTYRGYLVATSGIPEAHFRTCLSLVERVPVLDVVMPRDPDNYGTIAATVLDRVRDFVIT